MQISQLSLLQCPSNREFPEFFKTHPTFVCRSIFRASMSFQNQKNQPALLFFRPCIKIFILTSVFWTYCIEAEALIGDGTTGSARPTEPVMSILKVSIFSLFVCLDVQKVSALGWWMVCLFFSMSSADQSPIAGMNLSSMAEYNPPRLIPVWPKVFKICKSGSWQLT